ncbi:MAG: TIGR00730 family Rossman fold protein [Butyricimonas faecihominis]
MKERKSMMREKADAFIALPGGWGTLEEITEVITLKQLGIHNKPIIFLNTNDFYESIFPFISNIRKEGFVSKAYDGLYAVVNTVGEAVEYIKNYQAKDFSSKY